LSIQIVVTFFIVGGFLVTPIYLKLLYGILNNMVEAKANRWLVESMEKPFNATYQTQWNLPLFVYSFLAVLVTDLQFIYYTFIQSGSSGQNFNGFEIFFWIIALIVGHFGLTLMLYMSALSLWYVYRNTKIYDLLLQKIISRIRGYTDGHESILSKKNYEVVKVLSDTPGLSVRSLGDIPVVGLVAATLMFNSFFFILSGPVLLSISSAMPDVSGDTSGLTMLLLIGIVLSLIVAFGAVIGPLWRVSRRIGKFKSKALTELDPYLFDEITGVALKRESVISNETQVLYMLRNYIYSMKPSPINPLKLVQIAALALLYITRVAPALGGLL